MNQRVTVYTSDYTLKNEYISQNKSWNWSFSMRTISRIWASPRFAQGSGVGRGAGVTLFFDSLCAWVQVSTLTAVWGAPIYFCCQWVNCTVRNRGCSSSVGRELDCHCGVLGSNPGQALTGSNEGPLCGMYATVGCANLNGKSLCGTLLWVLNGG